MNNANHDAPTIHDCPVSAASSPTAVAPQGAAAHTTAQLLCLPELAIDNAAGKPLSGSAILDDGHPLGQVKARVQVCVGEATLSVAELLAARHNQVIKLDRTVDQPIDLLVEGKIVARGRLVAVDDNFAVQITQLPLPLTFGQA